MVQGWRVDIGTAMKGKIAGKVRIIGGRWRGRRLPVPDLPGLRPSGDRSRETLFNWLQTEIHGASCADLFAGTGALGLEAASRGAGRVTLVEKDPRAARALQHSVELLSSDPGNAEVKVLNTDALRWLESCAERSLDVVFIDPPFGSGLEARALELLDRGKCLAEGARVYLETARQSEAAALPAGWIIDREKQLGEVSMRLLKKI